MFSQECVGTYARFHDVIHTLQKMDDPPWEYTIVPLRRYYGEPSPEVLFRDGSAPLRLMNYLYNVARASREADIVHVVEGSFPYSLLVPLVVKRSVSLVAGPNVTVGADPNTVVRNRGGFRTRRQEVIFRLGLSNHSRNKLVFHQRSPISSRYRRIFVFKGYRPHGVRLGGLSQEKLVTLPSGVRTDIFHPAGDAIVRETDFLILYVGDARRAHLKGYDIFLKALSRLKETNIDFLAIMVGRHGHQENHMIRQYHLNSYVELVGFVPRKDLAPFYRAANVHVNSSRYESDNTAALEALACGTPVIGTDIPGINKYLAFQWGNDVSLSMQLLRAYHNKEMLKAQALRESSRWNIQCVIRTLGQVYQEVIG